jgi:hypothetical protein
MWDWLAPVLVFVFFVTFVLIANIFTNKQYNKTLNKIVDRFKIIYPKSSIRFTEKNYPYQIELINDKTKIIIKVIESKESFEFIITNADNWIINRSPQHWNRKTKPDFIPKTKAFIEYSDSDVNLIKIVVIYPTCKHVIRYLNESDTVIMKDSDNFRGINFVRFDKLDDFLKNQ